MIKRVRAIIIENNKLLSIKRIKLDSCYYIFPGGKVELNESLELALKRECREELGLEIEIEKKISSQRFDRGDIKQLEYFYSCRIVSGELGTGDGPEYDAESNYDGSHEIEWIEISKIDDYDLRPIELAQKVKALTKMKK